MSGLSGNESPGFKVLTYNINFGSCYDEKYNVGSNYNTRAVLEGIVESDADIVCLQETHDGWKKACEALQSIYPTQVWEHPDTGFLASGLAILLKPKPRLTGLEMFMPNVQGGFFPSMCAEVELPGASSSSASDEKAAAANGMDVEDDDDGKTVAKEADLDKKTAPSKVRLINVHLRPPLPMGNGSLVGWKTVSAYMWETPVVRKKEVEQSLQHFQGTSLFVGDFNEESGWGNKAWQYLCEMGFVDALQSAPNKSTWSWPVIWGLSLSRSYDHIFANPKVWELESCRVLSKYRNASDHMPVVAQFRPAAAAAQGGGQRTQQQKQQAPPPKSNSKRTTS